MVNYNAGDQNKILGKVNNKEVLVNYFKKAFNSALIDINIVNTIEEILDITLPVTNPNEKLLIDGFGNYFEADKKDSVKQDVVSRKELLIYLHQLHLLRQNIAKTNDVYLYLTNLKSETVTESETSIDSENTASNNGITADKVCMMFLGNKSENMQTPVEISHEVMHALKLEHTFKQGEKHIFEISKTKNYMDYGNTKESLWAWQWQQLH